MPAFRSKRRKGHESSHDEHRRNPRDSVGSLFLSLPAELRICILRELCYVDILSLRLASRSFYQLIEVNEAQVVRHHIEHHVPRHILELYPPPPDLNLRFLTSLAQRQWLSNNMAQHLAEYISKHIILSRNRSGIEHSRMRRRLVPLIFTLFHFFERYRFRLLAEAYIGNPISYAAIDEPILIQQEIMEAYNPALLLRVSQTYHLLLYLLYQRLGPKTLSLAWARSGRALDRSYEDGIAKLLIVGGINQVERIWNIKNHSRRRREMEKWIAGLQSQGDNRRQENSTRPQADQHSTLDREGSRDSAKASGHDYMPPTFELPTPHLSNSAIARLIQVLPPLRAIWVSSARDLILAKGLDAADVGVWELFIDELAFGDDSSEGDSGDEDPDDSGDEGEGVCLPDSC